MMKPPKHLAATELQLWEDIATEYAIDDPAGMALLTQCLEALQLARECRERIDRDGLMTSDGKPHVLLLTLRDARKAYSVLLKQLNLDLEPLKNRVGRPGSTRAINIV